MKSSRAVSARPSAAEYKRRYYYQRKRLGLCVTCGRKVETIRTRCGVCRRKARDRPKPLHPLFCGECKRPIKSEERSGGRRFHRLCAQKRQARRYPYQHRLAVQAYQRRHIEMGHCTSCPKKTFKANLCRKHYRATQERYHKAAG